MTRWYKQRRWIYAGLVLLLGLDAAVYFGWLKGSELSPAVAAARITQLERDVEPREAEVKRLRRVREMLPQARPTLASFVRERFPSERAGFSAVAVALSTAARSAGVQLENVSYRTRTDRTRAELVMVEVSADLQGGYSNLLRYLELLEQDPGFYLIEDLGVVSSQRGGLKLQMRLVTFFRRSGP